MLTFHETYLWKLCISCQSIWADINSNYLFFSQSTMYVLFYRRLRAIRLALSRLGFQVWSLSYSLPGLISWSAGRGRSRSPPPGSATPQATWSRSPSLALSLSLSLSLFLLLLLFLLSTWRFLPFLLFSFFPNSQKCLIVSPGIMLYN